MSGNSSQNRHIAQLVYIYERRNSFSFHFQLREQHQRAHFWGLACKNSRNLVQKIGLQIKNNLKKTRKLLSFKINLHFSLWNDSFKFALDSFWYFCGTWCLRTISTMRLWSSVSNSLDIIIWLKFESLTMNLIESSFILNTEIQYKKLVSLKETIYFKLY